MLGNLQNIISYEDIILGGNELVCNTKQIKANFCGVMNLLDSFFYSITFITLHLFYANILIFSYILGFAIFHIDPFSPLFDLAVFPLTCENRQKQPPELFYKKRFS